MALEHKIIIPYDAKEEFTNTLKSKLDELELSYKLKTKNVKYTEVTIQLDTSRDLIKHLFNLVKAPQEEIEYLCKAKSIVEATARDIINSVVNNIRIKN